MSCGLWWCQEPDAGYGVCLAHEREAEGVLALEREYDLIRDAPQTSRSIKIAAVALRWQPSGGTPYGRAVLARVVEGLSLAANGSRNIDLNRAAYLIAGYVAGGEIQAELALRGLAMAAEATGLRPAEYQPTIKSGFQKGLSRPISAPN